VKQDPRERGSGSTGRPSSVWAIVAAWVVLLGVFVYVGLHADDPGLPMVLLLMLIVSPCWGS
jgi:hypothetical protein